MVAFFQSTHDEAQTRQHDDKSHDRKASPQFHLCALFAVSFGNKCALVGTGVSLVTGGVTLGITIIQFTAVTLRL